MFYHFWETPLGFYISQHVWWLRKFHFKPRFRELNGMFFFLLSWSRKTHFLFSYILHIVSSPSDAYIIKLFDRSVDLAQFSTISPLYPICRAWMRNNPSMREGTAPSPPHSSGEDEVTPSIRFAIILNTHPLQIIELLRITQLFCTLYNCTWKSNVDFWRTSSRLNTS